MDPGRPRRGDARRCSPAQLWRVTGFVSPPHFTKPNRNWYWLFVNGRPVRSKTVTAALDQAYRSLTPEKRYPLALLDVHIDPAKVDVNVSPTKSEVKFHQDGAVFDAVRRAVTSALLAHGMVPDAESVSRASDTARSRSVFDSTLPVNVTVVPSVVTLIARALTRSSSAILALIFAVNPAALKVSSTRVVATAARCPSWRGSRPP